MQLCFALSHCERKVGQRAQGRRLASSTLARWHVARTVQQLKREHEDLSNSTLLLAPALGRVGQQDSSLRSVGSRAPALPVGSCDHVRAHATHETYANYKLHRIVCQSLQTQTCRQKASSARGASVLLGCRVSALARAGDGRRARVHNLLGRARCSKRPRAQRDRRALVEMPSRQAGNEFVLRRWCLLSGVRAPVGTTGLQRWAELVGGIAPSWGRRSNANGNAKSNGVSTKLFETWSHRGALRGRRLGGPVQGQRLTVRTPRTRQTGRGLLAMAPKAQRTEKSYTFTSHTTCKVFLSACVVWRAATAVVGATGGRNW